MLLPVLDAAALEAVQQKQRVVEVQPQGDDGNEVELGRVGHPTFVIESPASSFRRVR